MLALALLSSLATACGKATGGRGHNQGDSVAGAPPDAGPDTSGAAGTEAGADPELTSVQLEGEPIYTRVQRLTNRQWERAVTDILGLPPGLALASSFELPVAGTTEFDNNEKLLFVGPRNFADFEQGAEAAAALATNSPAALAALYDGSDVAGFVETLGRRAFRRPLTDAEQSKFEDVFALGESLYGPGFANGAALVVRALLQSPHFLYRTELGPAGEPLSGYEVASKLSFWLLQTTPDDALLDAAAGGQLDSDAGVEEATRRMLDDPRAIETMRDFHEQLLQVRRLQDIRKVDVPEYDVAINGELVDVSDAFFDHLFENDLGLRELLTSKQAYVSPGLAPLYDVAPPKGALELRELAPARAGYFMQIPFLALRSDNAQSDPIARGLALQKMACAPRGGPAIDVPLPPIEPGQSNRQRVSAATATCGGSCHAVYLDPLGFALEGFDGLGRERDIDNGQPVDTSGSYPFAEGVAQFADGKQLMNVMAGSLQVHTCYAQKVVGYALGRDVVEPDRPLLESLGRVSLNDSLKELAVALVREPAFRTRERGLP